MQIAVVVICAVMSAGLEEAAGWSKQEAVRIRQVRVEGNQRVKTETILNQVNSREGAVFNEKMIAEDTRRIVNMTQIAHVDWPDRYNIGGSGNRPPAIGGANGQQKNKRKRPSQKIEFERR